MKPVLFFFITFFLCFTKNTLSESNVWPSYYLSPDSVEQSGDTAGVSFYNRISYFELFKENAILRWVQNKNDIYLKQYAEYSVDNYDSTTRNQHIDLSGEILYPLKFLQASRIGLQWSPLISYNRRSSGRIMRSNLDVGPVVKTALFQIPIELKAGFSGTGWQEGMKEGVFSTSLRSYHGDPGFYGGIHFGDSATQIGAIPLYANFSAYGKSIRNIGAALVLGRVLFLHGLHSGDSLYFFAADSLSNGKEVFFNGKTIEHSIYSTTPWRFGNTLNTISGFKAKERLGFVPALYYNFRLSSVEYPTDIDHLNDMFKWSNSFTVQLQTISHYFFDYSGGLTIGRDFEDWVFRTKVDVSKRFLDTVDVQASLNDHHTDIALSDHQLRINLPRNLALEYELHASKDSRVYKTILTRSDTVNNTSEKDYIQISHQGAFLLDTTDGIFAKIFTEYSKSYLYYLHKMMSRQSKEIRNYRVGVEFVLSKMLIRIAEKFFTEADVSEFVFKNSSSLPPYSRRVSSLLSCAWLIHKNIELSGSWTAMYYDYGKWYGKEYFDTATTNQFDYYAIENKTNDNTVKLQLKLLFDRLNLVSGVSFRDIYSRLYDSGSDSYLIQNIGKGYIIEPSFEFSFENDFIVIDGKIGRIFNTIDVQRWSFKKNWDISLVARAEFR